MATGRLIVQTRTAGGASPVIDAAVTVYCTNEDKSLRTCATERTNLNGSTGIISLDTPSLAQADPNLAPPFATYRVDIDHPNYRPVTVLDVTLFSDITTSLPVLMLPLEAGGSGDRREIVINSTETGPSGSGRE